MNEPERVEEPETPGVRIGDHTDAVLDGDSPEERAGFLAANVSAYVMLASDIGKMYLRAERVACLQVGAGFGPAAAVASGTCSALYAVIARLDEASDGLKKLGYGEQLAMILSAARMNAGVAETLDLLDRLKTMRAARKARGGD